MDTVTHREMRNNSAEILRRVESGESLQISNRGRVVAIIAPASRSILDDLIAEGSARAATESVEGLLGITRTTSDQTTEQILDDVRGRW